MRVLHTADWHLGKKLGRFERYAEMERFIDFLVDECRDRSVDLVLIAGDLFDTPSPPNRAVALATSALRRLTGLGAKVVAIAGNHDSPDYFDNLHRFSELHGVHLVGRLRRPNEGGVLKIQTRSGPAAVACCPYIREHAVIDFFTDHNRRFADYRAKIGAVLNAFDEELGRFEGCVRLFVSHLAVDGAALRRARVSLQPRAERPLTIGHAFVIPGQLLPSSAHYTALGHMHFGQKVPAPGGPVYYSGSPLALEFGERNDDKQIVLVDVEPDRIANVKTIAFKSEPRLRSVSGSWEELIAQREEFGDEYLSLTVAGADAPQGLLQRAAEVFPRLVRAHLESNAAELQLHDRNLERDWTEFYTEYVELNFGEKPSESLIQEFQRIYAAVSDAPD